MNKILEKHFIKQYPGIFRDMYGPVNKTCMHWGIQCSDGWFHLIDALCYKIQNRIDWRNELIKGGYANENEGPISQVIFKQIKEKFGLLRIYYEGGDDAIMHYIDMAEVMSGITCEECGTCNQEVGVTTNGWIRVLCPKCAKNYMSQPFREDSKFVQDKKKIALFERVKKSNKRKK